MKMESDDLRKEITSDMLAQFSQSFKNIPDAIYTIDYCTETCGIVSTKENPSMSQLFIAVIRECILNIDSESSLWHKLKLLAFLLNLSSSNTQFSHLYDIFHKVEEEAFKKKIHWNEKYLEDLLINKVSESVTMLVPATARPNDASESDKDDEQSIDIYDDDSNIDSIGESKEKKDFLVKIQEESSVVTKKEILPTSDVLDPLVTWKELDSIDNETEINTAAANNDFNDGEPSPKRRKLVQTNSKTNEETLFYTCSICEKTVQELYRFQQHLQKHEIDTLQDSFMNHVQTIANIDSLKNLNLRITFFTCSICNEKNTSKKQFISHLNSHGIDFMDEETFKLSENAMSLGSYREISSNKSSEIKTTKTKANKLRSYLCNLCEKIIVGMFRVKPHLEEHDVELKLNKDLSKYITLVDNIKPNIEDIIGDLNGSEDNDLLDLNDIKDENIENFIPEQDMKQETQVSFSCDACDKGFASRQGLYKHNKAHHQQKTDLSAELNAGITKTDDDPDYVDDSYNDNFDALDDDDDYISHKKEESLSCCYCNKAFAARKNLRRHIKTLHPEITPSPKKKIKKLKKPINYTCDKCDESFMTRKHLIAHRKVLHPKSGEEDKSKCPEPGCEFACPNRKGLNDHWFEVHNSNKLCIKCGYMCTSYEDFISHRKGHKKEETQDDTMYACKICNCTYLGQGGLKRHMRLSHKEENAQEKVPCSICGKMIAKNGMNTHIQHMHGTQSIQCDLCDYVTNHKYKLTTHRKRHFLESKQCTACGIYTKDLNRHIRKCKKLQPEGFTEGCLRCLSCNMTFFKQVTLDKHNEVYHAGFKKHSCEVCGYKSEKRTNVRKHYRIMHAKSTVKIRCKFCNKNCVELDKHIKDIHPEQMNKSELEI